ncbi:MAG: hypothetical protein IPK19_29685 [Chloroflexi bacterium]|nr:hypothetical protein [Chloroflexota bacterium]
MLALTSNDEVNTLTALKYARLFGKAQVYQLAPARSSGDERLGMTQHLTGRLLFGLNWSFADLDALFARGAQIKTTQLTPTFDLPAYHEQYDGQAEPLFVVDKAGRVQVATSDMPLKPQAGMTLISIVPVAEPENLAVVPVLEP